MGSEGPDQVDRGQLGPDRGSKGPDGVEALGARWWGLEY